MTKLGYVIRLWRNLIQIFWVGKPETDQRQKNPDQGRGLTGGLGLNRKLETRFVDREPHEHTLGAEPADVPRARGAEDVKEVDDPITPPRAFTLRHTIQLLDGRLRRQRGALG